LPRLHGRRLRARPLPRPALSGSRARPSRVPPADRGRAARYSSFPKRLLNDSERQGWAKVASRSAVYGTFPIIAISTIDISSPPPPHPRDLDPRRQPPPPPAQAGLAQDRSVGGVPHGLHEAAGLAPLDGACDARHGHLRHAHLPAL